MLIRALRERYRTYPIGKKIFSAFMLILILAYSIIAAVNALFAARDTRTATERNTVQTLEQISDIVRFKVLTVTNYLQITVLDKRLQDILALDAGAYIDDVGLWFTNTRAIDELFFSTSFNLDFSSVKLYMESGITDIFTNRRYISLKPYESTPWLHRVLAANDTAWFTESQVEDASGPSLIAMKAIPKLTNLQENLGVLRIDINRSEIQNSFARAKITKNAMTILIDPDHFLCDSPNYRIQDKELEDRILAGMRADDGSDPNKTVWKTYTGYHAGFLTAVKQIPDTDWIIATLIPLGDLYLASVLAVARVLITFIIVFPLSILLTLFITRSITRRLSVLSDRISKVGSEGSETLIADRAHDEVDILNSRFDEMLKRIQTLLQEKFEMGQELNGLELKALQAQINPHFLYNTLDQLYWLSVKHDATELSELVLSLSRFYKLSLAKGKSQVLLRDELEHVTTYIDIQNVRSSWTVELFIDVDENLLDAQMPKITLQPIVENAILHGILEKESGRGAICISANHTGRVIEISVRDDGIGMDRKTLSRLFDGEIGGINAALPDQGSDIHGFSLRNIDRRNKLFFGPEFGLRVESEPGYGTSVIVTVPFPDDLEA